MRYSFVCLVSLTLQEGSAKGFNRTNATFARNGRTKRNTLYTSEQMPPLQGRKNFYRENLVEREEKPQDA